jgi:hypothetical protein
MKTVAWRALLLLKDGTVVKTKAFDEEWKAELQRFAWMQSASSSHYTTLVQEVVTG